MTELSREQLLAEGRKQARIYGVDPKCAGVYAEGWAAAHRKILEAQEANERQIAEHQAKWLRMMNAPGGVNFEEQRDRHLLQAHLATLHGRSEAFDFMLENAPYSDQNLAALDGEDEEKADG